MAYVRAEGPCGETMILLGEKQQMGGIVKWKRAPEFVILGLWETRPHAGTGPDWTGWDGMALIGWGDKYSLLQVYENEVFGFDDMAGELDGPDEESFDHDKLVSLIAGDVPLSRALEEILEGVLMPGLVSLSTDEVAHIAAKGGAGIRKALFKWKISKPNELERGGV